MENFDKLASNTTQDNLVKSNYLNKDQSSRATKFISRLLVLVLIFTIGFAAGSSQSTLAAGLWNSISAKMGDLTGTPAEELDLGTLWQAWSLLDSRFVTSGDLPSEEDLIGGLIKGLAESFEDPYTQYFNQEELERFNESVGGGSFSGVGMEIGETDGFLQVVAPLKGTPAYKAGIKPGDIIISIDEFNAQELSVDEAINLIRGPVGSAVTLTIIRKNIREPITFEITRNNIQVPVIQTKVADSVFVISLYSFSADLPEKFRAALQEYSRSNTRGLIIDVRNNPGGYLNSAIELGSWFTPGGSVLVREQSGQSGSSGSEEVYRSKGYELGILEQKPVVVLVNGGSASASEILAGILKDYDQAEIIGEATFGKGSVQELIPLRDGSAIKITTSRWLTPLGVSISEGGLDPDVNIEDNPETDDDEQLNKAISIILGS